MDIDLSQVKKIFFIGIGGIGISALAKMMIARGLEVSGINDEDSPKTLNPLRDAGAKIFYENNFDGLPEADLYVYSDAWIYRGPQILENARNTGKPVLSYFEALGVLSKEYKVIAIAGTHGKTTTTAMVAEILIDAGWDPTVVVGSFIKKLGSNFRAGQGEYLVVEADEYNRHFLNFHPFITVVTNIEADHLDCYKDLADVESAFNQLAAQSQNYLLDYSKYLDQVPDLAVPGIHNRQNAAAALAVADRLNIDQGIAKQALSQFGGTWRRLEKRGVTDAGTIVYDDYAHHPTEIRASLQALRSIYPKSAKNIIVLFQPHLYSRTKAFFKEFSLSFTGANRVMLLPIYFARENKDESVSSDKLAEEIRQSGQNAESFPDFDQAEGAVRALKLGPNDIFVTMGAGEAYKVSDNIWKLD